MYTGLRHIFRLAVLWMLAIPQTAQALSCAVPNLARDFEAFAKAQQVYIVGHGTLQPLGRLPLVGNGKPGSAVFEFDGSVIGPQYDRRLQMPVIVEVTCAASWCGGFPDPETPGLFFIERTEDPLRFRLTMDACPYGAHWNPSPEQVEAISGCVARGACEPMDEKLFEF